jgi:YbbR domain-containing protein
MMRRLVPKNLGWKLGSLLLAVLLWLAFSAAPDIVTTHTSPILYRNLAPSLLVAGDAPENIHVELRGPASQLTAASLADTVALFDLASVSGPGERTFTISDANLNLPRNVSFLRAVPSQLRLRFARLLTRDVPVQIRFAGTLPPGRQLVSKTSTPETLRIAGSETQVLSVENVETDAIDLSSVIESGEYHVNTFVSNPQVRFESSPIVTVKLAVENTANPH